MHENGKIWTINVDVGAKWREAKAKSRWKKINSYSNNSSSNKNNNNKTKRRWSRKNNNNMCLVTSSQYMTVNRVCSWQPYEVGSFEVVNVFFYHVVVCWSCLVLADTFFFIFSSFERYLILCDMQIENQTEKNQPTNNNNTTWKYT